jgi:hypothetical protein
MDLDSNEFCGSEEEISNITADIKPEVIIILRRLIDLNNLISYYKYIMSKR